MSQIKPSHLFSTMTVILALTLGGCGDKNEKAVFSPDSGHLSNWGAIHKTSAKAGIESCVECHGDNLDGGKSQVSCMSANAINGLSCHATSPAANSSNCLSCHGGVPSGPFGTTAPNRKSAHEKHTALTECATCHLGAGYGSASHAKSGSATVALPSTFNINTATGTYGYNSSTGKCTNISCHGGKTTPIWANGKIALVPGDNNLCLQCHEQGAARGVPQFNSFGSGINVDIYEKTNGKSTHAFHLEKTIAGVLIACTDCHNISALKDYTKHYGGITTKSFTEPGMTIGGGSPTKIGDYAISTKKCSNVQCHPGFGGQWVKE